MTISSYRKNKKATMEEEINYLLSRQLGEKSWIKKTSPKSK